MKKYILHIFILVALVQWVVPVQMLWKKENAIQNGKTFRLRTAPIDPSDPFVGKFIYLNLDISNRKYAVAESCVDEEDVYVTLKESKDGFAEVDTVTKTPPSSTSDYVKAKVQSYYYEDGIEINIRFPFERFYMEESKAPKAEDVYRKTVSDTNQVAYAVVKVLNGESAIVDVMINEKSIADVVREEK